MNKIICIVLFINILLVVSYGMAILKTGNPLRWDQAKPYLNYVRKHGIEQFLLHYKNKMSYKSNSFYWGDEIEVGIFSKDEDSNRFELSDSGTRIIDELNEEETNDKNKIWCDYQPEYGAWMVESVPSSPYGGTIGDLMLVEKNMKLRRNRLNSKLLPSERAPSMSNFPMMGVDGYKHTNNKNGAISNSDYISDEIINPHPRFGTLTRNIRMRRNGNVDIRLKDENGDKDVHMDAMAFGMGCCCLQV